MKKYIVSWTKKYAIDVEAITAEGAIAKVNVDEVMADIDHDPFSHVGHDRHAPEISSLKAHLSKSLENSFTPGTRNLHATHRKPLVDQIYGKDTVEEKCLEVAWAVLYEYLQDGELAEAIETILNDHTKDTSNMTLATHLYYWLCKKLGKEIT